MKQYNSVQSIIENTLDSMNETSPLSTAHLAVARVTTLLNHANDIGRFIEVQNEINIAIGKLNDFVRYGAMDTVYQQSKLFNVATSIIPILRNINNDLSIEINYRSEKYNYTEAVSNDHSIFTYKNNIEVLDYL